MADTPQKAMQRITVEHHESDMAVVEQYHEAVKHLCGLVIESFEITPQILLSGVMRKLVLDHAKKTEELRAGILARCRLYPDNPTRKPLGERT